jgi:hypothetical protein
LCNSFFSQIKNSCDYFFNNNNIKSHKILDFLELSRSSKSAMEQIGFFCRLVDIR